MEKLNSKKALLQRKDLFEVKDKDIVSVAVESQDRSMIFQDVVVRVSDRFALAMHIDTDECNAAGLSGVVYGKIVK